MTILLYLLCTIICACEISHASQSTPSTQWQQVPTNDLSTEAAVVMAITNIAQAHFIHGDPNLAPQVAEKISDWLYYHERLLAFKERLKHVDDQSLTNYPFLYNLRLCGEQALSTRHLTSSPSRDLVVSFLKTQIFMYPPDLTVDQSILDTLSAPDMQLLKNSLTALITKQTSPVVTKNILALCNLDAGMLVNISSPLVTQVSRILGHAADLDTLNFAWGFVKDDYPQIAEKMNPAFLHHLNILLPLLCHGNNTQNRVSNLCK